MRSFITSTLTLSSLCVLSNAIPVLPRSLLQKRAPQSYSVVAVDGGNTATAPASTHTVTNQLTQTAYTTILSTIILTESETPITVVVTATSAITITQVIPTAVATTVSASSVAPVTVTATPSSESTATGSTSTQPIVSSSAYDDGSWHTTYYSRWTVSTANAVVESSSSLVPASSSTTTPLPATTTTPSAAVTTSPTAVQSSSTISSAQSTSTDWATYYGSALATPKNGSWWGS